MGAEPDPVMKEISLVLWTAAAMALAGAQQARKGLEGSWEGTLDAGGTKLRLVLAISPAGGGYTGTLNSLDQGATIVIDNITLNGNSVRLNVSKVGGVYEGTLSEDRAGMAGTW